MARVTTSPSGPGLLALLTLLGLATAAFAQNPAVDQPHRRPREQKALPEIQVRLTTSAPGAAMYLWRGFDRLARGTDWLARSDFREALHRDPHFALAHAGMALARRETAPRSAAKEAWLAFSASETLRDPERQVVEAIARCFQAEEEPDRLDERFAAPPSEERLAQLAIDLRAIDRFSLVPIEPSSEPLDADIWLEDGASLFTGTLAGIPSTLDLRGVVIQALERRGNETRSSSYFADVVARDWCRNTGGMPYEVDGYVATVTDPTRRVLLPRHPHWPAEESPRALPPDDESKTYDWRPRNAPDFDLPRGLGGRRSLENHAGKPVLVVFFLGFGCVHCIEQLHALLPFRERFSEAGIDLVTIGTDSVDQVRASYQMAEENDEEPIPFDVLCDPEGDAFKQWLAWDEYLDEALHGTFLVDPKGRILWQDISIEPFMDTGFLLEESQRLLEVWKDR